MKPKAAIKMAVDILMTGVLLFLMGFFIFIIHYLSKGFKRAGAGRRK